MTPTQEFQQRIRQYLLGQVSDGAREEIEQEFLGNDEVFAELLIIEEELTDEYVNGCLSPEDRAQFESHFLATPERQEDLQFARALSRYVTTSASAPAELVRPPGSWVLTRQARRLAAAVAIVTIMAGALWFFFARQQSQPTFLTLTLTISPSTREEGVQSAKIGPLGKQTLRLILRLPDPSPPAAGYRVQLLDANGEPRPLKIAGQDAQALIVDIPAAQLHRGQFVLSLFAIKSDGTEQRIPGCYYFTVE
jgi:anti-sigma-K factor RskA